VWLQIFADVLQLPVELTACEELGAMGAAMAAGVGVGVFSSFEEAVQRMVRVTRTIDPDPRARPVYDEKYSRYAAAIEALRPVWDGQAAGLAEGAAAGEAG
jgi:L-xylulokinase